MTGETIDQHFGILVGDIVSGNVEEAEELVRNDRLEISDLDPDAAEQYEVALLEEDFLLQAAKSCARWNDHSRPANSAA